MAQQPTVIRVITAGPQGPIGPEGDVAAAIHGSTLKQFPAADDELGLTNSEAAFGLARTKWWHARAQFITNPADRISLTPSLDLDFSAPEAILAPWFTRASAATYFDSAGRVRDAASGGIRIDHRQGACRGVLIEESRTNQAKNNTLVGQVDGSPGTVPSNTGITGGSGLTRTIGRVTIDGVTYTTLRFQGTTADTGLAFYLSDPATASSGQAWTLSGYMALMAGSLSPISAVHLNISEATGGGSYITEGFGPDLKTLLTSTPQRSAFTRTLSGGGTVGQALPAVRIFYISGVTVDFTIAIGLQQFEQGAFITSPIKTSGSAATRAADTLAITGTDFSDNVNIATGILLLVDLDLESLPSSPDSVSVLCIGDGTTNEMVLLRVNHAGSVLLQVYDGGSVTANLNVGSVSLNTVARIVGYVATDNVRASLNGGAVVSDTSATMPTVDRMHLGRAGWFATEFINGHIRRVALMTGPAPTNTKLQEMSSQ